MASRIFPVDLLNEWGLPYEHVVYENVFEVGRRWHNEVGLVFRALDDGLTYRIYYPVGKSENSEVEWDEEFGEFVSAERVEPVTKMVEVTTWEGI